MKQDKGVAASPPGHSGYAPSPVPGLGHSASVPNADALVAFFNTRDGYRHFGRRGDYEGWSPEQTAAHFLAEYAARLNQADLPAAATLRLCGYCQSWNSKPCGEQCVLSANDPTWDQAVAQAIEARRAETGTGSVHESAVGAADAPNPPSDTSGANP